MNKAFVREPDDAEPLCPRCGGVGEVVATATLDVHVPAEVRTKLGASAYFCPTPSCAVAYFDAFEQAVAVDQLRQPLYPKDPAAPLCPCFGLTTEDVEHDLDDGVPRRIRELLAQSKTSAAHCLTASATGRCCIPEVQKYYFRRRAERGG
jgi:hypothetical protein